MIPRVYIAGPYSAPTLGGRVRNAARARLVARSAHAHGVAIVCPHLTGIELEDVRPDLGWEWWMAVTSQDLETCQAMVVVHDWEGSSGTGDEVKQASRDDVATFYAGPDGSVPDGFEQWVEDFKGRTL